MVLVLGSIWGAGIYITRVGLYDRCPHGLGDTTNVGQTSKCACGRKR